MNADRPADPDPDDRVHPRRGRASGLNPAGRFERLSYVEDPAALDEDERRQVPTQLFRDESRSVLSRNDSPDVPFTYSLNPYRGCEHGCIYCLAGETPVLMADGTTRPIEALRPGDAIYGTRREGHYRRYVRTEVRDHWRVEKPAFQVTLEDGTSLVSGADHRFLTDRGWKFVTNTSEGSQRPHLTINDKLMGFGKQAPVNDIEGQAVESGARLGVVAVEPLGRVLPLFDLTTGTGDFIADGVVSHNCYARPSHEYLGFSAGLDFETKLLVKDRAPELLREAFRKPSWTPQAVSLSGNTDPYQPAERTLRLTRRCLEVFLAFRNPVSIITKNSLITRDLDLLSELHAHGLIHVTISLTTLDETLAGQMEPRTTRPSGRLRAIEQLAGAGIPVGVFVAPLLPGLTDEEVPSILRAAREAGAAYAGYTVLRLPGPVAPLFFEWLERTYPNRAGRVRRRMEELRGPSLDDARFHTRMRGEGTWAQLFSAFFRQQRARLGYQRAPAPLNTAAFRRGEGQLGLFDTS